MISSDTIVACATPYGYGGIAVVRISGENSFKIVKKIIKKNSLLKNRFANFISLFTENGDLFDRAVLTAFYGPNSYTGENTVEISCHGNPAVVSTLIKRCVSLGARIAEPGEFTRRAFLNGKLDLIQVEAVSSLIFSNSEKSVLLNQRILSGALSKKLNDIKETLIKALMYVEFELDISEEELVSLPINKILRYTQTALIRLKKLSHAYKEGRLINHGASVVITGKPNVGKSTLLNALLDENKAIVSASPGTTRDTVDARLIYNGICITLTDTAGIRETTDHIEKEGVARAMDKAKNADLVVQVFDAEDDSFTGHNNFSIPTITVINKIDLLSVEDLQRINNTVAHSIKISAQRGHGVSKLKKEIKKALHTANIFSEEVYLTTQRQYKTVNTSIKALQRTQLKLKASTPPLELVSIDIREALSSIDRMLGKTTSEDILNNVFSHFCVGK